MKKSLLILFSALAFYEILKSHAIQGLVVTVGGLTVVLFYFVRSRFQRNYITFTYIGVSIFCGIMAVLGTLQIGPLDFLYKR